MESIRSSVLRHFRANVPLQSWSFSWSVYPPNRLSRELSTTAGNSPCKIMARVIGLLKKFDKIDAAKVTQTADFQKDLCLDSLDRVELAMAFEQEFSIEIPDEKVDKLTCCADVVNYTVSKGEQKDDQKS